MKLTEHPDREALTLAVAQDIAESLGMALKTRDRAVLCLPGGSTPVPVYKALAAAPLDWARVVVLPGDERWVAPDHNRSNARLIRRNLIDEGAAAELVPLYTEGLDPDAGAAAAAALWRRCCRCRCCCWAWARTCTPPACSRGPRARRRAGALGAAGAGDHRPGRARAAGDADPAGADLGHRCAADDHRPGKARGAGTRRLAAG